MNIAAVIPARYGSARFPGKPLAGICGKPMIQWVYENTLKCSLLSRVIVATDNAEIAQTVTGFGGEACMTSDRHETGTDRIAEVAKTLDMDLIVNVQGDEPLLPSEAIACAIQPLLVHQDLPLGTLKTRFRNPGDIDDPNIVKVVTDSCGRALYFSRSAIPFMRSRDSGTVPYRHIGIYVYQRDFLLKFAGLPQTPLEKAESLEQLRALEYGYPVNVAFIDYEPIGVDVPDDISKVEERLIG